MLTIALIAGLTAIIAGFAVYGLYFFSVLNRKGAIAKFQDKLLMLQKLDSPLEKVSIIVSTFNEAKVIARKIDNVSELNYPLDKLELLVFDDASIDGTAAIAERAMAEKQLFGKVIRNSERIGLNRSLNAAVLEAKYNFICVSDSDVLLEKDSLRNAVRVLQGFEGAGGVTGKVHPVFENHEGIAQSTENSYRGFYDSSMLAESALHSAFPGNGPLVVFDKAKVHSPIPVDYGSTDGNIAINVIKHGLRFIYVPNAIIYEPVAENLSQQRLQKVRRAKRLLQVILHNMDILGNKEYGLFGKKIFLLKFLMLGLSPVLLIVGSGVMAVSIVLSQNILLQVLFVGALLVVLSFSFASKIFGGLVSSFVLHQFYLFAGLLSSFRKSVFWKTIDRKSSLKAA